MADVVDPDDERLEVLERALRLEIQDDQPDRHDRQAQERDLQIGVHHERRSVLLDVPAPGFAVLVAGGRQTDRRGSSLDGYPDDRGRVDSPARPEKSELVSDGTLSRP